MAAHLLRTWHSRTSKLGKLHQCQNQIAEDMRAVKTWRLLEKSGWRLGHRAASLYELAKSMEGSKNDTDFVQNKACASLLLRPDATADSG